MVCPRNVFKCSPNFFKKNGAFIKKRPPNQIYLQGEIKEPTARVGEFY
jgi:hypothetical protein